MRKIRGNRIAMVFQEPMTSLNPLHTVGKQINEVLEIPQGLRGKAASAHTLELLELVGIPEPRKHPRLPARTVRRPAPARDDRHGPGQRAGAADRR